MADQKKMLEVKGAEHRSAKTVAQEGIGCQKVMMVVIHEMVGLLEMERMAETVEMVGLVDWHQTKMMEAKGAVRRLAKGAELAHSKVPMTTAQRQE